MSDYLCPSSRWADSLQKVRLLVDEEGVNPWKCCCTFATPLNHYCAHGNLGVVKYLIEEKGCDPNCVDQYGKTALHYATENTCKHIRAVKYLIETGRCKSTAPIENKHMEVVKYLIETGRCDPNCVDQYGRTALHYATENKHMEVALVKYLVETGRCDPNYVDQYGRTALHYATENKHMEVVKYLIETGRCDPNCVDKYGNTPLHFAVKNKYMEVALVKYLVETGRCDPNYVDQYGRTALHYAVKNKHMEVVKYLIETGHCDPNCVDMYGETPFHYAAKNRHMEMVKYLIETGRCDPNCADEDGKTALHYATENKHMEVVKCLVETGRCDPNCVDKYGDTPLHYATKNRHVEMVKYLIETGRCDPNCVDKYGNTPLQYALENKHLEVVKCLIETGRCDPNCVDKYGNTPLQYALENKHLEVVKCLIETGRCDPNCADEDGKTALHYATENKHMEVVKCLVETGRCDPNCVDKYGDTPLHYATKNRHVEMVKYLIETGRCDPNCVDKYGNTPLQYALENKHLEVVKCLIETGRCDPNCKDSFGNTPLHLAIRLSWLFKYLVESCNCDPECADNDGWTPLHHASRHGYDELVQYLLVECHCNPNCKTKGGRTPLDLAVNFPKVAKELIKAGVKVNTKLPQPPVKVFIVGNPSTGKSSLKEALLTETSALGAAVGSIFGPRMVQDVEPHTAGIVPCQFTSKKYGPVIFYDFAGQQEYYASHAALLQNSISSSTTLFIIVVNLCDSEEDIKQKLAYWISLLANQCVSVTAKPHVIIVGSHKDVVRSRGEINMEFLQRVCVSSGFVLSIFIPMDCRQSNSFDMVKLAESMKESCDALREELVVTHRLHHLFTHLLEEFKDTPAVSVKQVLQSASSSTFMKFRLSAHNSEYLHTSCVSLNDSGHILYLRHDDISKSWIILDQAAILSEVNGILFAPTRFKQHCDLATSSTGIVPLSRLVERFPHHDPYMLVQLLSHLEFCREILDHEVLQLVYQELPSLSEIEDQHEDPSSKHYFFFPGLISADTPNYVWEPKPCFSKFCGWMLQCCEAGHLLTSQFLQVLLLRLAFSCALAPDYPGRDDHPVLKRKCSIWKNGIYWGTRNGVEALVEITDPPQHRQVVVMLRCVSGHEVDCACLCSTIIKTVLEAKRKLCCKVPTEEFFLQPSQVREYPFKTPHRQDLLSIREVSKAVVEGGSSAVDSAGRSVGLNDVLLVEPYAHLNEEILQELFSEETETISDRFIYSIADRIYYKKDLFIDMFKLSRAQLAEKIRQAPPGDIEEFVCVLQCWRGDSGTYRSLRETLDQFSVFAGRNPLVSDALAY